MSTFLTALCCVCGNIRECRRPRNRLQKRRRDLALVLIELATKIEAVDAGTVNQLAEIVDRVAPGGVQ
jgi:hypothetical protein